MPELSVSEPESAITPEKVSFAKVMVSALVPNVTLPEPSKLLMLAPEVVALISNIPFAVTLLEVAIEPAALKLNVPAEIVVAPV